MGGNVSPPQPAAVLFSVGMYVVGGLEGNAGSERDSQKEGRFNSGSRALTCSSKTVDVWIASEADSLGLCPYRDKKAFDDRRTRDTGVEGRRQLGLGKV